MYQLKNKLCIELDCILYRSNVKKLFVQPCRPTSSFVYYIKGGHIFKFNNEKIECRAGEILYIPQGASYTNYSLSDDTEYYQIEFNIYDKDKAFSLFNELKILDKKLAQKYIYLFSDAYNSYIKRRFACSAKCLSNILILIDVFSTEEIEKRSQNGGINRIANTLTYINEFFYLNTPISELAKISSTSVSNLEKLFKQCVGLSPSAYRNKIRIEYAEQLLAGGYSIEETANLAGFSDRYYFSKIFKKMTGITPSAFMHSYEI